MTGVRNLVEEEITMGAYNSALEVDLCRKRPPRGSDD